MFVRFYQGEPEIRHRKKPKKRKAGWIPLRDVNHYAIFIFTVSVHCGFAGIFCQSIAYSSRKLIRISSVRFWRDR
jgi:hypothetical protein